MFSDMDNTIFLIGDSAYKATYSMSFYWACHGLIKVVNFDKIVAE